MKKRDRLDAKTQAAKSRRKAPDPPDALDSQTVSNNPKKARVPEETAAWRAPSSAEAATAMAAILTARTCPPRCLPIWPGIPAIALSACWAWAGWGQSFKPNIG